MPDSCCAVGCTNRRTKDSKIPFYRIPRCRTPFESRRRQEWIKAINRADWTTCTDRQISNSRICGAHFVDGKKSDDPSKPNWIPTIFSPFKQKGKKYREKRIKGEPNSAVIDLIASIKEEPHPISPPPPPPPSQPIQLLTNSAPIAVLSDNTTISLLRDSSSASRLKNITVMANNYSPKPENVQLAFNPVLQQSGGSGSAGQKGGPHYSTPVQVARPPQPPQETKPRGPAASGSPQSAPPPPPHGHVSYQSKYGELLNVIEDLGREIKPTYAGSKMAQERLKKGIMHARALVRECLAEVEKSARQ